MGTLLRGYVGEIGQLEGLLLAGANFEFEFALALAAGHAQLDGVAGPHERNQVVDAEGHRLAVHLDDAVSGDESGVRGWAVGID